MSAPVAGPRADLLETVRRLSRLSRRHFRAAHEAVDWPAELDRQEWCFSPELVSVYGTPTWERLDDAARRELGFREAVNFFSLNISGEKALMQGLAERLYSPRLADVSEYLHHFLDEENKHSVWFATFCLRYAGAIYPERKVAFASDFCPQEEDLLFFARIVIFEQIVDAYNVAMGRDGRLAPVVRQINALHHADEARHLVFGQQLVAELWQRTSWTPEQAERLREYLGAYLVAVWRDYYNPAMYADAGLDNPWALARQVWESDVARAHRQRISAKCVSYLLHAGVLESEPAL